MMTYNNYLINFLDEVSISSHLSSSASFPTISAAEISDIRLEDIKEADLITEFTESGCECTTQCSKLFSRSHYECMRNQCVELSKENLDMVMFGQIMALLPFRSYSDDMKITKYMHRGHEVKLITELKIFETQMFLCLYRL